MYKEQVDAKTRESDGEDDDDCRDACGNIDANYRSVSLCAQMMKVVVAYVIRLCQLFYISTKDLQLVAPH